MDAKTRDEEAAKGKKESFGDTVRRKLSDALTPAPIKKIKDTLDKNK